MQRIHIIPQSCKFHSLVYDFTVIYLNYWKFFTIQQTLIYMKYFKEKYDEFDLFHWNEYILRLGYEMNNWILWNSLEISEIRFI